MKKIYLFVLLACYSVFCFGQKDSAGNNYKPHAVINYQSSISKGDLAFSGKDYLTAKRFYKEAASVKPSESYPKEQIEKCDNKMSSDSWMSSELDCPCLYAHSPVISSATKSEYTEMVTKDTLVYSVFPGKVSSVVFDSIKHTYTVSVKHGKYIAKYSNLSGTHFKQGDEVKEGDKIGFFKGKYAEYMLRFSIWNGKENEDIKKYVRCKYL